MYSLIKSLHHQKLSTKWQAVSLAKTPSHFKESLGESSPCTALLHSVPRPLYAEERFSQNRRETGNAYFLHGRIKRSECICSWFIAINQFLCDYHHVHIAVQCYIFNTLNSHGCLPELINSTNFWKIWRLSSSWVPPLSMGAVTELENPPLPRFVHIIVEKQATEAHVMAVDLGKARTWRIKH